MGKLYAHTLRHAAHFLQPELGEGLALAAECLQSLFAKRVNECFLIPVAPPPEFQLMEALLGDVLLQEKKIDHLIDCLSCGFLCTFNFYERDLLVCFEFILDNLLHRG